MKSPNQKGFTLVELSIVLVIIGLLIGGILAAQSMITTTKIQAFARQIGQFDAAVMNYKDKFAALPGDDTNAMGGTGGNGNGIVNPTTANKLDGEPANFWVMLQTSGFKSDDGATYVPAAVTTTQALDRTMAPQGKAGEKVAVFASGSAATVSLGSVTTANAYVAAGCNHVGSAADTLACTAGFTGQDAKAIDIKLDDGVGDSGNVEGVGTAAVVSSTAPLTAASADYTIDGTSTLNSSLVIRMGNTAGNPQ